MSSLIRPAQAHETLLADCRAHADDGDDFNLWWLGQSGFLIAWQRRWLLFDPYLSDSLTRKYASTDKPHVRMTELVVEPSRLGFVDVVTSSHTHTDHLDPETLKPLTAVNTHYLLVGPEANRVTLQERSGLPAERVLGLDAGTEVEAGGFRIRGIPAAHEKLDRDTAGRHIYVGFIARFGRWTVYHAGDTIPYDGMEDWLRPWQVDVALLPINGRAPERRVTGNLWGREAAHLARSIGARIAIPCHYDMFTFNTATPDEFVMNCQQQGQGYAVLRGGERWCSSTLSR
jgi:L-ascorbate metabolism protein UlaG (beta-lactamase superfamily)